DVLEEARRHVLTRGQGLGLHGPAAGRRRQRDQGPQRVVGLRRYVHGVIVPAAHAARSTSPLRWRMAESARLNTPSTTIPITRITIISATTAGASVFSRANWSRAPIDGRWATITSSSPAIRLRHANAQPCFRPATNAGSD